MEKEISQDKIREVYSAIKELKREVFTIQADKKEATEKVREKIANIQELTTSEGKTDIAKVKSKLVAKAIDTYLIGKNKLEGDLETVEQYVAYIKNKDIPKSQIDRIILLSDEEKNAKSTLTSTIKTYKVEVEENTLKAILSIVDEELKTEFSGEEKKEVKNIDLLQKFYELVSKVKKILK